MGKKIRIRDKHLGSATLPLNPIKADAIWIQNTGTYTGT
jgi:hypothetical protein